MERCPFIILRLEGGWVAHWWNVRLGFRGDVAARQARRCASLSPGQTRPLSLTQSLSACRFHYLAYIAPFGARLGVPNSFQSCTCVCGSVVPPVTSEPTFFARRLHSLTSYPNYPPIWGLWRPLLHQTLMTTSLPTLLRALAAQKCTWGLPFLNREPGF